MTEVAHREIEIGLREVEAARLLMAQMHAGPELACIHLKRAVQALATVIPDLTPSDSPWHAVEREVIPPSMKSQWKTSATVVARCADHGVDEDTLSLDDLEGAARTVCDLLESAFLAAKSKSPPIGSRRKLLVKVLPGAAAMAVLSAAIWTYSAMTSPSARARARVPRIVLVSIDTLHVNRTGPYNPAIEFTPFLNRFADEGIRFATAYTHTANTLPSHATLMTGISPAAVGVMTNGDRVPDDADMLAETLARAGYRTGAFISLRMLRPASGMAQGFDDFDNPFADGLKRPYRRAEEILESVRGWLQQNHEKPFFLWVHLSDPHAPYVTPDPPPDTELWLDDSRYGRYDIASREQHMVTVELPPGKHRLRWVSLREPRVDDLPNTALELLLTKSDEVGYFSGGELPVSYTPLNPDLTLELSNEESESVQIEMVFTGRLRRPPPSEVVPNYDDSIAYADLYLGKLEELIGTLGVRDETLFIIVSDHGEGLFAHDTIAHARHVYEDQTRVLWMMRGPDIPKGQIIDQRPALLMDLAPTVLDLLGLGGRGTEGRSLVGCWDGSSCPESDPWWAFGVNEETRGLTSMASYRWPYKWIWRRNTKRTAFDLTTDPWEESDLLAEKVKLNLEPLKTSAEAFQAQRRYLADVLQQSAQTTDTGEN